MANSLVSAVGKIEWSPLSDTFHIILPINELKLFGPLAKKFENGDDSSIAHRAIIELLSGLCGVSAHRWLGKVKYLLAAIKGPN